MTKPLLTIEEKAVTTLLTIEQADLDALHRKIDKLAAAVEEVTMQPKEEWVTMREYAKIIGKSVDTVRRNLPQLDHKDAAGTTLIRRP